MAGLRGDTPSHTSATKRHWCGGHRSIRKAWLRCRWAAAGPGRASRSTTPSRQARVWLFERAGRRPPAHTAARPIKATRAAAGDLSGQQTTQPPGYAKGAGTEVPAPCRLTQPLPRRGLRPDDRQSWRRRRIHRNMPPTTAAPRPAPPIRPSKPVRARPCFGLVAGTSGAT